MMSLKVDDATYGIGAVATLTGIPLNTLRAWERRYALVTPQRGKGNQRQYARSDVVRLQLVKQLVDRGHAISALAGLDEAALREQLQLHRDTSPIVPPDALPPRVLIYGDALPFLVNAWRSDLSPLQILGTSDSYAKFEEWARSERPDVLVLEWPALDPEVPVQLDRLQAQTGARRLVVVYGFAPAPLIDRLQRSGIVTLRAPVAPPVLREACRLDAVPGVVLSAAVVTALDVQAPLRRFDSRTLAAVANAPTGVRCECPHHLADLVFRLSAFETYSAECESRSEQDAALHSHLHRVAGQARALLEEALEHLIRCEKIDLSVYS